MFKCVRADFETFLVYQFYSVLMLHQLFFYGTMQLLTSKYQSFFQWSVPTNGTNSMDSGKETRKF